MLCSASVAELVHIVTRRHQTCVSSSKSGRVYACDVVDLASNGPSNWNRSSCFGSNRPQLIVPAFEAESKRWHYWMKARPVDSVDMSFTTQDLTHYYDGGLSRRQDCWWTVSWSMTSHILGSVTMSRTYHARMFPGRLLRSWIDRILQLPDIIAQPRPKSLMIPADCWIHAIGTGLPIIRQRANNQGSWILGRNQFSLADKGGQGDGDDVSNGQNAFENALWQFTAQTPNDRAVAWQALAYVPEIQAFICVNRLTHEHQLWHPSQPFYRYFEEANFDSSRHRVTYDFDDYVVPDMRLS